MTSSQLSPQEARRLLAQRILDRRRCEREPWFLIRHMSAPDERTTETFNFGSSWAEGWEWQQDFLDWVHSSQRCISLKARQLGVTWLACAYVVWTALYRPDSLCLVFRQKEEEAWENLTRCHRLLLSLPKWAWNGAVVEAPTKGALAKRELVLRFPSGKRSRVVAMTSASASGHGKTAAVVLLDEFSRIERAAEIMKAVQPAAGSRGKILIISTANGVSDPETGDGNHFHYLWVNAEEAGFQKRFLPWSLHPDRDDHWYGNDPEVRGLRPHERAEQYPANEDEAFTLTNRVFFDPADLLAYAEKKAKPLYRFDFERVDAQHARFKKHDRGMVTVYVEPNEKHSYAIGADVASGHGADYSAAYVVDLGTMGMVAEFHGRLGEDQFAFQLHYLGKWYGNATLAVETQGGYGNAVIIPLRDGREGRPPYPKLYRHILSSRPDLPISKPFGWPTNTNTRPKIINGLEKTIRERTLPWVTDGLLKEMQTFVRHDHGPSPAAQTGMRDDRVMAACIALEMYRLYGHHPDRKPRTVKRDKSKLFPWQRPQVAA